MLEINLLPVDHRPYQTWWEEFYGEYIVKEFFQKESRLLGGVLVLVAFIAVIGYQLLLAGAMEQAQRNREQRSIITPKVENPRTMPYTPPKEVSQTSTEILADIASAEYQLSLENSGSYQTWCYRCGNKFNGDLKYVIHSQEEHLCSPRSNLPRPEKKK